MHPDRLDRDNTTYPLKDFMIFAIAQDDFMSGWGKARGHGGTVGNPNDKGDGRSLFIIGIKDPEKYLEVVLTNMRNRGDFSRVRTSQSLANIKVRSTDHVVLHDALSADRFFEEGGW